ncbi:DUF3253 domain-containing protein [Piscinibacter sakaiensis]|uniref:DUF3253 domain-containing protein n=1 Tax=Piscinibacter sakaiensis TaxID=1547922 RepID=A0A0K8P883_PISS1|nr:DUF3253 domain-containing protein [Piscinibacter sakaiensis]GAP38709.1 hypothetical protein ISF6_5262 [Piscinibacter sakaiensis]
MPPSEDDSGRPARDAADADAAIDPATAAAIEAAVAALLHERPAPSSFCPSEAARRAVGADGPWRAAMDAVRALARRWAREGRLQVTQRGRPLDPDQPWRGAIRLGRPRGR